MMQQRSFAHVLINNRLLPSVLFFCNPVAFCCCWDLAVNQPFSGFAPCMKKIRPNTEEPITSFVLAKW